MVRGDRVTPRGIVHEVLPRLWRFNNDVTVELAGGGDPPLPQSLNRPQADLDREAATGGRDGARFAIEVDGCFVGRRGPADIDETHRMAMLGITIGDQEYWGRGDGREAVRLLLDDAFRRCNQRQLWLWVHADNARATAAYRARGFVEGGRPREHVWSNGRDVDAVRMGVLRTAWPTS